MPNCPNSSPVIPIKQSPWKEMVLLTPEVHGSQETQILACMFQDLNLGKFTSED